MLSERSRRELYEAARSSWGEGAAEALMSLVPPLGWIDVARRADVDSLRIELKGEMAELKAELTGEMAGLRGEMAGLRAELKGEMAELRADVNARIGGVLPKLIVANIASMTGLAGLVLAAVQLG